jgi:hypothetical protein
LSSASFGYRLRARPIQGHALPSGGVSGHYGGVLVLIAGILIGGS